MTEQQAQNITAFLELARTAIDNAELRIVGATDGKREGLNLVKATSEITAAVYNLCDAVSIIKEYAESVAEKPNNGAATNGVTAGRTVPAEQKTGSDRVS